MWVGFCSILDVSSPKSHSKLYVGVPPIGTALKDTIKGAPPEVGLAEVMTDKGIDILRPLIASKSASNRLSDVVLPSLIAANRAA
ncbi:MAG: hypothetical protein OEY95_00645 [Candidatus Bathyarchaeota archaeon]|nr:hypothetical protein [Candidatus Bathyarchaeota archaeon]